MPTVNASADFDRYVLLRRTIDDSDIRGVFGRYPKIEKRVRRNHQRYFLACLRTYEREVWSLNSTRIRILAADGKWLDSGRAVARATAYGRLCLRLRWAATLRSLRLGNPVGVVENCVSELRRLDACEALA
jgi:hypothetical protein